MHYPNTFWYYFESFLKEGRLPDYTKDRNEEALISEYLVNKVAQQETKIDTLLKVKYAHDGLLKSNIIKCALWLITLKKLFLT